MCKTKLCSLLEQKQRLEDYLQNQAAELVYVGRLGEEPGEHHISVKRAPGMEFLGKRSQAHRSYNIPVLNKRAPGKYTDFYKLSYSTKTLILIFETHKIALKILYFSRNGVSWEKVC